MAWSPEERAVREANWLVERAVVGMMGDGKAKPSPFPEPPEEGWMEKKQKALEKELRHVERLRRKEAEARKRLEQETVSTETG